MDMILNKAYLTVCAHVLAHTGKVTKNAPSTSKNGKRTQCDILRHKLALITGASRSRLWRSETGAAGVGTGVLAHISCPLDTCGDSIGPQLLADYCPISSRRAFTRPMTSV